MNNLANKNHQRKSGSQIVIHEHCPLLAHHRFLSMTSDLGKQLTIGPEQFVEPDSALRCRPSPLPLFGSSLSSPSPSLLVTAPERCPAKTDHDESFYQLRVAPGWFLQNIPATNGIIMMMG